MVVSFGEVIDHPDDKASGVIDARGKHLDDKASGMSSARGEYPGDEASGMRGVASVPVTPRPDEVHSICNCRGTYVHQVPL